MSAPLPYRYRSCVAFTLVELLVVIGIIALLISILLPTLSGARERANAVKCSSNLRTIGMGLLGYSAENRGLLPAAYMYAGAGQTSGTPSEGYIHWSSYLYGDRSKLGNKAVYLSQHGWDAFTCPSLDLGGLPPTNTFAANVGIGVTVDASGVTDQQSPRMAYTVNEALMPRNKFKVDFDGNPRVYQLVKVATVKGAARTVLATEFTNNPAMAAAPGRVSGGMVCKSHRPVHGFKVPSGGDGYELDKVPPAAGNGAPSYSHNYELLDGINPAPTPNRLEWIGRNHGRAKVNGAGQDLRTSNFLYLDGHVETKRLCQTLYPEFQWGDRFYSVRENEDYAKNDVPSSGQIPDLQ